MKLRYFKQASLDQFKSSLPAVTDSFASETPWMDQFFKGESWSLEAQLTPATELVLVNPEGNLHHDLENSRRVHECLKSLTIRQATDERLWTYLALVPHWSYMRKRWPMESYSKKEASELAKNLQERYFFLANKDRALVRNGISRLWWYGHVSYDADRDDPYELTAILLEKLDIAQSLLERSFSRNPIVCRAVLNFILKSRQNGLDASKRKVFRTLMQHLNRLGGIAILDLLTQAEIEAELDVAASSVAT